MGAVRASSPPSHDTEDGGLLPEAIFRPTELGMEGAKRAAVKARQELEALHSAKLERSKGTHSPTKTEIAEVIRNEAGAGDLVDSLVQS